VLSYKFTYIHIMQLVK